MKGTNSVFTLILASLIVTSSIGCFGLVPMRESLELIRGEPTIKKIDAKSLKDMGKAMGYLKERYPGQIDFSKASIVVRNILEN